MCGLLVVPAPSAHADVYHAVAKGETLAVVAAKYRVSVADLRAANGLKGDERAVLPAMLLRVPGALESDAPTLANLTQSASDVANDSAPRAQEASAQRANAPTFGSSAIGGAAGSGYIARTMSETVRAGDTWELIAQRYRAAGYDVDAGALSRRNADTMPAAGQTVIVPLDQFNYVAPASNSFGSSNFGSSNAAPRIATNSRSFPGTSVNVSAQKTPPVITPNNLRPRALGDGVYASGESTVPVAKDVTPSPGSGFGPGGRAPLASRGGYGQLARTAAGGGEVRILTPEEDAPTPRGGTIVAPDAVTQPVVTGAGIARVANVALTGATIRRLPEASAAVLFKCKQNSQLAVLTSKGMWSAVLMSDRSTGWVPTKYLTMTDQTVDVSQQAQPTDGPGGDAVYNVGQYSTKSRTVAQALRWLGTPYVYGGTGRRGIDCSAMVQNSFKSCGINLPRTAAQQATVGQKVDPANLQPGDRLYFSASGTRIDHTGLYMGNGLFVHASGSGRRVMVSNLFQGRNWNIFVGARR